MPSCSPRPTSQLQQAIAVQLVLARGFPRSTGQLVDELTGQPMVLTTRRSPITVGRAEIVAALETMRGQGVIVAVSWPGPEPATDNYWVLPQSPWAR